MQCVILAAGEGKRMRPLTADTPKPLVEVDGVPLLARVAAAVPEEVDEFIIVEGYLGEQIKEYCGDEFLGRPVTYVNQPEKRGTADALLRCETEISGPFMLLYADDLFAAEDLAALAEYENALLVLEHGTPQKFGVVELAEDGTVAGIVEKPSNPPTNLVSVGPMMLTQKVFEYEPERHDSGELVLPSMVNKLAQDVNIDTVEAGFWFPVATPEDVAEAEALLSSR